MEGKVFIDGKMMVIEGEKSLLDLIRKAGIELPTFCYQSELSVYGACRMCVVEADGRGIVASCHTAPEDGMVVRTNTKQLRKIRKANMELLLANHDRECTTCVKNRNCRLQELAESLGITRIRFSGPEKKLALDESSCSIVRNPNKCILCGDCVRMCEEIQGVGVLGFAHRGERSCVTTAFGKNLEEVECVHCGQCAAVCPTGAISIKQDIEKVWAALSDKDKVVVAQIAPAVRVAIGEAFGLPAGEESLGKIASVLRQLGVAKVFDTAFAADLTIVEEYEEFLERFSKGENLPQFTSCCPAWVKYVEQFYPEFVPNLSSCRSPQQMFGSLLKKYYAQELKVKPENLFVLSIMPCTAKKYEAGRPEFTTDGVNDVDAVITTNEIASMIKEAGIDFRRLDDTALDMPFGAASGSGVGFGATGGVAKAVLMMAREKFSLAGIENINYTPVEGIDNVNEVILMLDGRELRVAAVQGLGSAKALIDGIRNGKFKYDLVEVMGCVGGCIGGAGQPLVNTAERRDKRASGLKKNCSTGRVGSAKENELVKTVYQKFLAKPASEAAHNCLHTSHTTSRRIAGEQIELIAATAKPTLDIEVCVGTCCYLAGSYEVIQALTKKIAQNGVADRINLRATFCFENCQGSSNIRIGDKLIGNVSVESVDNIFINEIMAAFGK